ncbi:DNA-binding protein [Paenarthrobacter nitroguajacolicus]|nr:DNA-binding protein [Paenarthrobacter nitroguajacolicus]
MPDEIRKPRFLTIERVAEGLKSGDLRGIQVGGRNVWRRAATDVEDCFSESYRHTTERIAAGDLPENAAFAVRGAGSRAVDPGT